LINSPPQKSSDGSGVPTGEAVRAAVIGVITDEKGIPGTADARRVWRAADHRAADFCIPAEDVVLPAFNVTQTTLRQGHLKLDCSGARGAGRKYGLETSNVSFV
jgi:hypothetical protein